ncbi:MAG: hypothetical protein WAW80_00630 [Candidatus Saccharimonadales bacterium]
MNQYLQTAKKYINKRNELFIGIAIIFGAILIAGLVVFIIRSSGPNIVFEPAKACDLFTPAKATSLIGEKIIGIDPKDPVINGDVAMSDCSYTDTNPDQSQMIVAAIAVRSGINEEGVKQNKTEFVKGKPKQGVETVNSIGSAAYFNQLNGQLNVLDGHNWIIVSYGVGASPETNTIEKAVELVHKVLPKSSTTKSS